MKAGNLVSKTTIDIHYLSFSKITKNTKLQKRLVVSPHQITTLVNNNGYKPPKIKCDVHEIDCWCSSKTSIFDEIVEDSKGGSVLIWLDPTKLTNEALGYIIYNWKQKIKATQNIAIGIIVPKVTETETVDSEFFTWKINSTGARYDLSLENPVWYPSLERKSTALENAAAKLKPYDTFPLIEFPKIVTEYGEESLTNHAKLLEKYRTRTRNFIYLDVDSPCQAFNQLSGTFVSLPRGRSFIQPVVTPGGNPKGYLSALLAGVISESYFFTPMQEIPMNSNNEIQGIIVLEKCI